MTDASPLGIGAVLLVNGRVTKALASPINELDAKLLGFALDGRIQFPKNCGDPGYLGRNAALGPVAGHCQHFGGRSVGLDNRQAWR